MWDELTRIGITHAAALSLQVGLLVAVVYALSVLARRGPAEVRYVLWLTVALRLLWPAGLESPVGLAPALDLRQGADADHGQWAAGWTPHQFDDAPASEASSTSIAAAARESAAGTKPALSPLVVAWLAGVGILTLHFVRRWWWGRRFVASCAPNRRPDLARLFTDLKRQLGLRASIELRVGSAPAQLRAPAVFGLWRPVVLLPSSVVDGWRLEEIEPVLIHEMVHLKRLDLPINALQCVLQAVYFFHPMVWLMNWKIRQERELVCDDEVVRRCGGRSGYVRSILRVVEDQGVAPPFGAAIGMASRPSSLGRRVERLLDRGYRRVERRRLSTVGAFLLGLLCVGVVSGRRSEAADTARPAWSEEAEALFALDPEENLRLIDPANFASRLDLYRTLHPAQAAAVPAGPQRIRLTWDASQRRFAPPRFSFGSATLGQLLHLLGVESHDVVGATAWLREPLAGDLAVRRGADLETLLSELNAELAERHRLPLRLELREATREVVVVRGRYSLVGGPVRVGEPLAESTSAAGECPEVRVRRLEACLHKLSGLLGRPVIDEVDAPERHRVEWYFSPVEPRDPDRLLADLARQTSLRFDKEERRLQVVFITESESGVGG